MKFLALFLLFSTAAFAQSPDVAKYASRQILLVAPQPGTEGILPLLVSTDGQQRLEFVPTSQIKDFIAKGAQPIRLGDILSLLGASTETINKLQAENKKLQDENDRLWKVAMKDAPRPETVIVQQPSAAQAVPSEYQSAAQYQAEANARRQQALQMWMTMQNNRPQPYQLPMPINPSAGRLHTNCIANHVGNSIYTNCN